MLPTLVGHGIDEKCKNEKHFEFWWCYFKLNNVSKHFDNIIHNPHLQYPNKLLSHQCLMCQPTVADLSWYEDTRRKRMWQYLVRGESPSKMSRVSLLTFLTATRQRQKKCLLRRANKGVIGLVLNINCKKSAKQNESRSNVEIDRFYAQIP